MRDQLNKGEHLLTPLKQKKKSFFQGGETKRMKTRKVLASLLAFAMLLSLVAVPVGTADAASTNYVDRVVNVAKGHTFDEATPGSPLVPANDVPYLMIEEKNAGEFKNATAVIELTLKNAEFLPAFEDYIKDPSLYGAGVGDVYDDFLQLSDNKVRFTVLQAGAIASRTATGSKAIWEFPLYSEVTEDGEITVSVDGDNGFVSKSTLTYAVSAKGGSIASIGKVNKFSTRTVDIDKIIIDETRLGSLDSSRAQTLKLRLPSNFTWEDANGATASVSWTAGPASGTNIVAASIGEQTLEITIPANDLANTTGNRGTLILEDLAVRANSSAKFGDVSARISGGLFSTEDLVVATYQDYGVNVALADEKEDLPELYAGRWADVNNKPVAGTGVNAGQLGYPAAPGLGTTVRYVGIGTGFEEHELAALKISENSEGAWLTDRVTRIDFPTGVKVIGVEVVDIDNLDADEFAFIENKDANAQTQNLDARMDGLGKNYIEIDGLTRTAAGKASVELVISVSVAATFSGDIVATVGGRSLSNETTEVVLGKAINPVKVEMNSVDLRIGVLQQSIGDIIITETEAGAIQGDRKVIAVNLGGTSDGFTWATKPTVEVIEGDIEILSKSSEVSTSGRTLSITVKSDSSKPSKIKISGGAMSLDRSVPEGVFSVSVGGTALVENSTAGVTDTTLSAKLQESGGIHAATTVASDKALNVITPAPGEERKTVKFNLDSKDYVVIEAGKEVTKTMDVAPYNENGRALLPLRFVAEALGVSEDNIVWNANTKEVTIFKGDRIAKVAIGSNVLTVNGTTIVMDTTAAIKDGRTVLPIRFVGQALGATIGWDDATRTITVQQ